MLKRTPLFETHRRLGARLVEFGGWEMPVQYTGIMDEHRAVRTAAGLFDIAHMGEVLVSGPSAEAFLNGVLTNDIRRLVPGQGQYTLLCNPAGGVIDDLYAYRVGEAEFLLIVNASRIEADFAWLSDRLAEFPQKDQTRLENASDRMSAIAVQGPRVAEFIDTVLPAKPDSALAGPKAARATELKRNRLAVFEYKGAPVWVCRTGYTGEDGFELVADNAVVASLWDDVLAAGAASGLKPCGLGARDTLRTEMVYPLYGHELSETISPLEAGLDVFVKFDKAAFVGRDALARQAEAGVTRKLAALRMRDASAPPPRPHYAVWDAESGGTRLGETTSGTLSPSLGVGIALALVPAERAEPGGVVYVEVRGRRHAAEVVKKPFYRRQGA